MPTVLTASSIICGRPVSPPFSSRLHPPECTLPLGSTPQGSCSMTLCYVKKTNRFSDVGQIAHLTRWRKRLFESLLPPVQDPCGGKWVDLDAGNTSMFFLGLEHGLFGRQQRGVLSRRSAAGPTLAVIQDVATAWCKVSSGLPATFGHPRGFRCRLSGRVRVRPPEQGWPANIAN